MITKTQASIRKKNTMGLALACINQQEALQQIIALAHQKQPAYVCFANAHMTVEAKLNPAFSTVVNSAKLIFPDGKPLCWAIKLFHQQKQERVAGMDMMPKLLAEAEQQQLRVYFYGSKPEVLANICQRAKQEYPYLQLVGYHSPPFRPLQEDETLEDIKAINQSKADLIFVALGCPKQEKWMAKYSKQVNGVMLGVGAAFPVYAQLQSRAPKWMQHAGLEWLFRLVQEPKRLWKRYLITNSYFIWMLVKAIAKKRKQK